MPPELVFSLLLSPFPEVQLLDHIVVLVLIFRGSSTLFSIVFVPIHNQHLLSFVFVTKHSVCPSLHMSPGTSAFPGTIASLLLRLGWKTLYTVGGAKSQPPCLGGMGRNCTRLLSNSGTGSNKLSIWEQLGATLIFC